jgi:xanthine dehydrogenase accessory factor
MNAQVLSPQLSSPVGTGRWFAPLRNWPRMLLRSLQSQSAVVRVVVAEVKGSAPRESGACMLVERSGIHGTIGGGHLEYAAVLAARALLDETAAPAARLQRFVLGTELAQCCGGVVDLWLERYTRADAKWLEVAMSSMRGGPTRLVSALTRTGVQHRLHTSMDTSPLLARTSDGGVTLTERLDETLPALWLYGAGHVGQALVRVLAPMPLRIVWIDSRPDCLPADAGDSVELMPACDPEVTIALAPAGTHFLIMTHSHALDYALCRGVLEHNRFGSVGVIGSRSKAARFRSRLARDGLCTGRIAALACPIGIDGIHAKDPAIIAVAVAAQLLQTLEASVMHSRDLEALAASTCSGSSRAECVSCTAAQRDA